MTKSRKLMSLVVAVMYAMCVLVAAPVQAYAATGKHVTVAYTTKQKAAAKTAAEKALAKLPATAEAAAHFATSADLQTLVTAADKAIATAKKMKLSYTKFKNYGRLKVAKAGVVALVEAEKKAADEKAAAEKAAADKKAADAVTAKIALIPATVAVADEATVTAADTAYKALTADQQKLVTTYATVTAAIAKIAELKAVIQVKSVVAANLRTLVVTFNKAVDSTTITTTTTKVYIGTSTTADVYTKSLSTDKTVLTLAYSAATSQDTNIKLVMSGVKDAAAVVMADTTTTVKAGDVVAPTATGITVNTPKTFDLTFSEPMSLTASSITNGTIYAERASVLIDGVKAVAQISADEFGSVTVTLLNAVSIGAHTIKILDLRDAAGFKMVEKEFSITIANDTTAPTIVSAKMIARDLIEIKFSEALDATGLGTIKVGAKLDGTTDATTTATETISGYTKEVDTKVDVTELAVNKYIVGSDNVTYTFRLGANPVNTLGLVDGAGVYYNSLKDVMGNTQTTAARALAIGNGETTVPTATVTVVAAADTTAGVAKNDILVTFNEEMSVLPTTLEVRDANNNLILNVAGPAWVAASNVQTFQTTIKIAATTTGFNSTNGGTYKVVVKGAQDAAIRQNTVADTTATIAIADTKVPAITSVTAKLTTNAATASSTTPDKITITFPEAMDKTTLSNPDNYLFSKDNEATAYVLLSASADYLSLTPATDGKSVVVAFKSDISSTATDNHFKFLGLKDANGNLNTNYTTTVETAAVPAAFNHANIDTVTLVAKNKIEVALVTGSKFDTIDPSEFGVAFDLSDATASSVDNIYAYGVAYSLNTDATIATITLNKSLGTDGKVYNPTGIDNAGASNTATTNLRHTMTFVVTKANRIATATENTVDPYGNKLAVVIANNKTIDDAVAPVLTYVRQDDSTANNANNKLINICYDETIANNAASFLYDVVVKDVTSGVTLVPTTDFTVARVTKDYDSVGLANNAYQLTIIKAGVVAHQISVAYPTARYVADAVPNKAVVLADTNVMKSDGSAVATVYERTAPQISTIALGNKVGGTADTVEAGDTITITFTEAVDASLIAGGLVPGGSVTGVLATATGGVTGATGTGVMTVVNIATFNVGASLTGGNASFTTDLALSENGKVLTITLNTGTSRAVGTPADINAVTFVAGTVKDLAGNALAAGGAAAASGLRF